MNTFDLTKGFNLSLYAGIIVISIYLAYVLFLIIISISSDYLFAKTLGKLLNNYPTANVVMFHIKHTAFNLLLFICFALAVFCFCYSILNLFLQQGGITGVFKKENTEILVSRLFALLSCISIFGSFFKIWLYETALAAMKRPGDKVYKEFLDNFYPEQTDFNLLAYIEIRNLTQVTIFLFSLFALQLARILMGK